MNQSILLHKKSLRRFLFLWNTCDLNISKYYFIIFINKLILFKNKKIKNPVLFLLTMFLIVNYKKRGKKYEHFLKDKQ